MEQIKAKLNFVLGNMKVSKAVDDLANVVMEVKNMSLVAAQDNRKLTDLELLELVVHPARSPSWRTGSLPWSTMRRRGGP